MVTKASGALLFGLAAALALVATAPAQTKAPLAEEKNTFGRICGTCHAATLATASRRTRDQWYQTVNEMINRGAPGSPDEFEQIVDYLSRAYGKIDINTASAGDLSDILGLSAEKASAIVRYRREHGTFENFQELLRVLHFDEGSFSKNRDAITFGVVTPIGRVSVGALTAYETWPAASGSPQRQGWSRHEQILSPTNVGHIKQIYKVKIGPSGPPGPLGTPLVTSGFYGVNGVKQLVMMPADEDSVYSTDADVHQPIWEARLTAPDLTSTESGACGAKVPAITIPGSASAANNLTRHFAPQASRVATTSRPAANMPSAFRTAYLYALASDGKLHELAQPTGHDVQPAVSLMPPNHNATLTAVGRMIYAATTGLCNGMGNAVYALDLTGNVKRPSVFETNGSAIAGSSGVTVGLDGTIYIQVPKGHGDPAGSYNNTVLSLTPDLVVKDHFTPAAPRGLRATPGVTPAVFEWNGKETLAVAANGRLYLLNAASLGGSDHHTPLAQSDPIDGDIRDAFATWEDPDTNTRWIYVSMWPGGTDGATVSTSKVRDGAIAAFTVKQRKGRPTLNLAWISRDLGAPAAPIVANGVVYALATSQPVDASKRHREQAAKRAVLFAFDASNGNELFNSGNDTDDSSSSGLALANGQIYFTTRDRMLYAYGYAIEH